VAAPKAKDVPLAGQGGEGACRRAEPESLPGKCPLPGCSEEVTCGAVVSSIFSVLSEVKSCKVNLEALKGRWGWVKGRSTKGSHLRCWRKTSYSTN